MAYFQEGRPRREPFLRAPASVTVLILLIVLAHVARSLAPPAVSEEIIERFALIPAFYSPDWLAAHHLSTLPWYWKAVPFVGHIFLHSGYAHLTLNCLWLLAFAPIVARRYGGPLFLVFFFICGFAGAGLHLAVYWGSEAAVVGASGAISGVMAASIRMLRLDLPFLAMGRSRLLPLYSRQVVSFTLVWMAINAFVGITGLGGGPVAGPIAWIAHVGGYVAGLVLSAPFDVLASRRLGQAETA